MYVQGVSTRKVTAIAEQLCGASVSASLVSKATAQLDETLEAWRNRPLGEFPYVFLGARYEKVRQNGQVRDAAILIAVGVGQAGKRQVLGVSVSLSEYEIHWRIFLQSLVARGLSGVQLITSDDDAGLKAARIAIFGGVPWQRCQFHLQQNAKWRFASELSRCSSIYWLAKGATWRSRRWRQAGSTWGAVSRLESFPSLKPAIS
jgi:putative transposase